MNLHPSFGEGLPRSPRKVACIIATLLAFQLALALTPVAGQLVPAHAAVGVEPENDGFDTCSAPTRAQMNTWWSDSPYFYIGIYIGGTNRGCSQPNLDSTWVTNVSGQGWAFIPTWVGLQDPCTQHFSVFSTDTSTARNQGNTAADNAIDAAKNLGFSQGAVLYADLEGYDTSNNTCVNAAHAFIKGWDEELSAKGWKSGVYGSSSASGMDGLWGLTNNPDDGWVAKFDGNDTVWGISGFPNADWEQDRRTKQYRGGHNETYGGVTLNIDTDCSVGQLDMNQLDEDGGTTYDPPGTNESNGPSEDGPC